MPKFIDVKNKIDEFLINFAFDSDSKKPLDEIINLYYALKNKNDQEAIIDYVNQKLSEVKASIVINGMAGAIVVPTVDAYFAGSLSLFRTSALACAGFFSSLYCKNILDDGKTITAVEALRRLAKAFNNVYVQIGLDTTQPNIPKENHSSSEGLRRRKVR